MAIIPKRNIIKNVNISISTVNLKASDFIGSSTKYIAKDTNKIMTQNSLSEMKQRVNVVYIMNVLLLNTCECHHVKHLSSDIYIYINS
jgi:hypothetical protein